MSCQVSAWTPNATDVMRTLQNRKASQFAVGRPRGAIVVLTISMKQSGYAARDENAYRTAGMVGASAGGSGTGSSPPSGSALSSAGAATDSTAGPGSPPSTVPGSALQHRSRYARVRMLSLTSRLPIEPEEGTRSNLDSATTPATRPLHSRLGHYTRTDAESTAEAEPQNSQPPVHITRGRV